MDGSLLISAITRSLVYRSSLEKCSWINRKLEKRRLLTILFSITDLFFLSYITRISIYTYNSLYQSWIEIRLHNLKKLYRLWNYFEGIYLFVWVRSGNAKMWDLKCKDPTFVKIRYIDSEKERKQEKSFQRRIGRREQRRRRSTARSLNFSSTPVPSNSNWFVET